MTTFGFAELTFNVLIGFISVGSVGSPVLDKMKCRHYSLVNSRWTVDVPDRKNAA
jgi:hypothetical protein